MPDTQDFDERLQDGHFEAKWTGRPKVLRPEPIVPPAPEPEVPEPEPEPEPEPDLPDDPDAGPPPATSLGEVSVTGPTESTVEKVDRYIVSADGDANPKTFTWSSIGGQVSGSGLSVQVYWLEEGDQSITCKVTSSDEGVVDSPTSFTVNVTVAPKAD